jgi:hypothetical protein
MSLLTSKPSPSVGTAVVLDVLHKLRTASQMVMDAGQPSLLSLFWIFSRMLRAMLRSVILLCPPIAAYVSNPCHIELILSEKSHNPLMCPILVCLSRLSPRLHQGRPRGRKLGLIVRLFVRAACSIWFWLSGNFCLLASKYC